MLWYCEYICKCILNDQLVFLKAPDCGPEPSEPAFVPMIWGYHEDNPWHDDESDPVAAKYHTILGFNEPNHADQSDIDPETAAAAWIEIQEMYLILT